MDHIFLSSQVNLPLKIIIKLKSKLICLWEKIIIKLKSNDYFKRHISNIVIQLFYHLYMKHNPMEIFDRNYRKYGL
jgi:hypothetical protein